MAMSSIAYLGSFKLPEQFSYKPYIPRKRKSVVPTANGVVTQYANPEIVHGDSTISFTIPAAFANEWQSMYTLYRAGGDLVFTGYWGETLVVRLDRLDNPQVRGRLFNVSGQFQVLSETTQQSVTCGTPGIDTGLLDRLVAFWSMEEAITVDQVDYLLNHPLAPGATGPSQVSGLLGNAARFASANATDTLTRLSAVMGSLNPVTGDFTVSLWLKPVTVSGTIRHIVGVWDETGNQRSWRVIQTAGDKVQVEMSANGTALSFATNGVTLVADTQYHLVFTYDATADQIAIRVSSVSTFQSSPVTASHSNGGFTSTGNFLVGQAQDGTKKLDGDIDALGVWNRLLSSVEQQSLFNGGAGLEAPFT